MTPMEDLRPIFLLLEENAYSELGTFKVPVVWVPTSEGAARDYGWSGKKNGMQL